MKSFSKFKASTAPLVLGIALLSSTAYAQDADVADEEEATGGSIVVTGSRIARPDLEAVSPITSVSAEQIQLTGTVTLETLLNDLPQVIPGNNRTSNNAGGEPFATLDLRGLGPNRTLILVDGERLAASSTLGTIDVSQIPLGLLERVDVVTGGATAVYGSDAIAGVINFVLKDDYEGLEITTQAGIAEEGVGFNFNVQGLFGGNFADGRGNITVSASYFDRDAVSQDRFDYSRVSGALGLNDDNVLVVVDELSDIGSTGAVIFAGGSGTNPFGTVVNSGSNPFQNLNTISGNFRNVDSDCNPNTATVAAVTGGSISFDNNGAIRPNLGGGFCQVPIGNSSRYNFAPNNLLAIPFDRFNLATTGKYEFSDSTVGKLYASYTRTESTVNLAPTPAAGGTGFLIAADAPAVLLHPDLVAALNSRPNPNAPFNFNRRFNETGPRIGINESETIQIRAFIDHKLNDQFNLNVVGSYGRSEFDTAGIGNINRTAVEQGINGCRNQAGVVNGPGVLPGCRLVDPFGINQIDPAAVRFIQTDTFDQSAFEQVRVAANLTGTLFELPAGPVGVAVGAEYRKDTGESIPDDAKIRGEIIGFNAQQPIAGSVNVKEAYGELRIPLLGGKGGFPDLLAIEGGARYSDYSSVGNLFNYKVGVEFAPFQAIRFRAAYNKAARAPSVFELFQNGDQGFPAYIDRCNQTQAGRDAAFCVSQGVPAGAIQGFAQNNQQVQAFAFGNPGLTEEDAETYTIGAVIAPSQFPLGRFSLTVDYYNIKLADRIAAQGAQFFIDQCYQQQIATACARITRNTGTGQIDAVNTTLVNGDTDLKTSGIDAAVQWVIPLDELFSGANGRIRINELLTWVDKFTVGGTEFVDTADAGLGAITSEWASTLTVAYENDKFTGQVRWVYKSGGDQSNALFGPDEDTGFTTPRVPDLNTVQLSLRYRVNDRFSLTGIVDNIFDEFPPQTAVGTFEQANTNASFYSPLIVGRSFSMQATVKF